MASRKCHQQRIQRIEELQQEVEAGKEEGKRLQVQIEQLQLTLNQMRAKLQLHSNCLE
jgi:HAMP domain-containing protein